MTFEPTTQQRAFLDALIDTKSHLALVARAGCGKTATILMGVDVIAKAYPKAEIAVCAFNKAIAEEVKEKLQKAGHKDWKTVQAATLHSMGFGLLKFVFKPEIDPKKIDKLVDQRNDYVAQEYRAQIISLVRYAKQAGFGFFSDCQIGDRSAWYLLADHYDVNGFDETDQMDQVVDVAQAVYQDSLRQTDFIDFDDMILFPLVKNLRVKFGKDFLFLDEAQDLSRSRQALARKFLKPNGRMIVVGDDRQAIYGFSGADSEALDNLITGLNAIVLPLSMTWRCPKAVVAEAQKFVPDIVAAETAPDGQVLNLTELPNDLGIDDVILCRNTAPLIDLAYGLIRSGKPAKVEGRAIGEGLIALAKRWKIKTTDKLLKKLDDYEAREVQKALAKGDDSKAEAAKDKCDTLRQIVEAVISQGKNHVDDVIEFIDNLFADGDANAITLATYHRAKGREWLRVYLWEHSSRCPSKAARQDWQLEQEDNLAYVAISRAKQMLAYVN